MSINASAFKARCLAVLDRVLAIGKRIMTLKRGRPVAELGPTSGSESRYPQSGLRGTVTILGDVIEPVIPPEHWESVGE